MFCNFCNFWNDYTRMKDSAKRATGPRDSSGGRRISSSSFYGEYHGHTVDHLTRAHSILRSDAARACCFLVGDSSMDNKFWLGGESTPALNGYEKVLTSKLGLGKMVKDICYHVNKSFVDRGVGGRWW